MKKVALIIGHNAFPSPYGVSFILMFLRFNYLLWLIIRFHLLMEYSSFLWRKICFISTQKIKSFCLLSEYYSFLWLDEKKVYRALRWRFRLLAKYHSFLFFILNGFLKHSLKSFRLLAEYHSFLLYYLNGNDSTEFDMFPSPYGVSFILICVFIFYKMQCWLFSFRLLMEYHSFLLK